MLVAMVVQSLSPILRGLAGLLPLHTLVGGLLQRLHSLLSISAVLSLALSLLTVTLIYTYVPGGKRPHTGSAAGGRRCGSGVDAVFPNILVLHRAFLEVIVHLRFFGCNRADYALAECDINVLFLGAGLNAKIQGMGQEKKGKVV